MNKPSVGRIVHYVFDDADERGAKVGMHHAAIIVAAKPDSNDVALQVFRVGDFGGNHLFPDCNLLFRADVPYDDGQPADPGPGSYVTPCQPGTWHWPERE